MDGLWEEHPDVRCHAVLYPQGHVAQFVLKQVRAGRGDVEDGRDAAALQQIPLRRVTRAAQEQKGQDLYRTALRNDTHTHCVRCFRKHDIFFYFKLEKCPKKIIRHHEKGSEFYEYANEKRPQLCS